MWWKDWDVARHQSHVLQLVLGILNRVSSGGYEVYELHHNRLQRVRRGAIHARMSAQDSRWTRGGPVAISEASASSLVVALVIVNPVFQPRICGPTAELEVGGAVRAPSWRL